MADLDATELREFAKLIVQRGLGLYGRDAVAQMCYDAGIALTDTNDVTWLDPSADKVQLVQNLLREYGSRNLPARMTAIVLARQHSIPVPEALLEKKSKKQTRFKFWKRR